MTVNYFIARVNLFAFSMRQGKFEIPYGHIADRIACTAGRSLAEPAAAPPYRGRIGREPHEQAKHHVSFGWHRPAVRW